MLTEPVRKNRPGWPPYYTVILLLLAAVFISYIDRTNLSVARGCSIRDVPWKELGFRQG